MTRVPTGWQAATLGDVCQVVSGATPRTSEESYWGGDINWVTPMDLSRDRSKVLKAGARSLSRRGLESCGATVFPAGSVMVSSRAPVGYVAIAGTEMCTSQGCKTVIPPPYIDSNYLYWFLVGARADLQARASGTTFKEISKKRFAETVFMWPLLSEQRRIVTVLEDHLSRIDHGLHGAILARRRLASLAHSWMLRRMTPTGVTWSELGSLLLDARGGWSRSRNHLVNASEGVPYLKMNNITRTGRLDLGQLVYVRASPAETQKYGVLPGDVLFNSKNSGDLVGKTAVADERVKGAVLNENIMRLRFVPHVEPEFAALWFRAPIMRREILRAASASTNVAAVYQRELVRMPIWLPELSVQRDLVDEFDELSDAATRMSAAVADVETHAQAIRSALLAAAFSGRLSGDAADMDRVEELVDI